MPSKSKKQHNFMEAIAHSASFAKKVGVPQSVGKDFSKADKGKTFKRGGEMNPTKMGKPVMKPGMSTAKDGMKRPTPMADTAMGGGMGMMKKGGKVKKMAAGGLASGHKSADGIASKGKTKGKQIKMAMGGMAKKYC
jgi:hypothetical protein